MGSGSNARCSPPPSRGPVPPAPHVRLFHGSEEEEPEKKEVSELRSELWEKEMKLTDIRLEALNSAHQLDQLRETMHNMQVSPGRGGAEGRGAGIGCGLRRSYEERRGWTERGRGEGGAGLQDGTGRGSWLLEGCSAGRGVSRTRQPRLQTRLFLPQLEVDLLKAENDRLKVAPGPSAGSAPGQIPGSSALPSPRRSLGLALTHPFSPSLADTGSRWGEGPGLVKRRKGFTPHSLWCSFLGASAAASRHQSPETLRIAVVLKP